MNAFKKINKNGSITIPKEIRAEAGLFAGNGVEVQTNDDGSITIKPSAPCCHFCGSPDKVITVQNIKICTECATKVLAKVDVTDE
jgi:transcriptional pleiotropic regulator of transition state genes